VCCVYLLFKSSW